VTARISSISEETRGYERRKAKMSVEANKALLRRFYEEIDKGNLEALDEIVAEGLPMCADIGRASA
jgi:hypothetical protein